MERKTHRESWKGEESVKDRFTLSEPRMLPFLVSEFTVDQAKAELQKKATPALGADDHHPACQPHAAMLQCTPCMGDAASQQCHQELASQLPCSHHVTTRS